MGMELHLPQVDDFAVDGTGGAPAWEVASWQRLMRVGAGPATYATRAKLLWSATGIYGLVDCEDRQLTCTLQQDFANLFTEDVVEAFFWTDEAHPVYFEYEISPLGRELPILVANDGRTFHGWLPWHFEGPRRTRKAAAVRGGPAEPYATVQGWQVEFFLPFALLRGLGNTPPSAGTSWRANLYRIDYDEKPVSQWAWCPDTGCNFHACRDFGTIVFSA